jgi:hypothetical protein
MRSLVRAVPNSHAVGPERAAPALSVMEACRRMSVRLRWYGLPQLRPEQVKEIEGGLIGAVVRDPRNRRDLFWTVDRQSGIVSVSYGVQRPMIVHVSKR